jgi:hypothetical protein
VMRVFTGAALIRCQAAHTITPAVVTAHVGRKWHSARAFVQERPVVWVA